MFSNEELVKNSGYWLDQFQNDIHFQLKKYMEENGLNQRELATNLGVSPGYISQVLNGNFNFSLKKLIDTAISIGVVPQLQFVPICEKIKELNSLNSTKVIDLYNYKELVNETSILSEKKLRFV